MSGRSLLISRQGRIQDFPKWGVETRNTKSGGGGGGGGGGCLAQEGKVPYI